MADKSIGTQVKEAKKVERKALPNVSTVINVSPADRDAIEMLLSRGATLKQEIGKASDPKKNKAGEGQLGELDDIREKLAQFQFHYQLEGLRFGNYVFVASYSDGRASFDKDTAKTELVAQFSRLCKEDVDVIAVINECFAAATSTGQPFLTREIEILD